MAELLVNADLFYFAGVFTVPPGLSGALNAGYLAELLRTRVQYNQCAFFGVCCGAMIAGATNHYNVPGLDIFDGITVRYDANVSAGAVDVGTSYEQRVLQMTTGCALALCTTEDHIIGRSFTTIKNQSQWWDFAERNTEQVQRLLQLKCNDWKRYVSNNDVWHFNLRGYIWSNEVLFLMRHGSEDAEIVSQGEWV